MQQAPAYGIHRGAKPQHLADGGFVKAIKGLVSSITDNRKPDEAPVGTGAVSQAKTALTGRAKTIDDAEKKAVGMAKGGAVRKMMKTGGEIPGKSPTPTADNIPISATAGEFMIRQPAVQVIGVDVLKAINKLGGKAAPATDKKPGGAVRKMYGGGLLEEANRRVAPYVNHRAPSGPPVMQEQLRLTNGAPPPGTSVATRPGPNFTMGGTPQQPPPYVDPVTDVRAKFNPANASPEAKAFMADRAANPGPRPAGAPPQTAAQPSAARAAAPTPTGRGYGAGRMVGGAVRSIAPTAIAGQVASHFNDYKINDPAVDSSAAGTYNAVRSGDFAGAGRSLSKGALETLMDVGSAGANLADFVVPGNAPVSTAYDNFLRGQFGDQLAPAPGVGAQPAPSQQMAPVQVAQPAGAVRQLATGAGAGQASPGFNDIRTDPVRRTLDAGGTSLGGDITRYDVPGKSPLFTNLTGEAGQRDNAALLSRGAVTAQNQGAMDGIQARQDAAQQGRANKDTYDAQVADAQRANQFELDKNLRAAALGTPSFRGSKAIRPSRAAREILAQDQRAASEQAGFGITRRGQDIDAQRNAATQQGQAADRKLAQDKFDLEKDGAKLDQKAKGQLSALQDTILDPKATPEVRKSAIATYRALTGKADTQNRFTVVPGGQAIDPTTNAAYTLPSQVIDNQTGQFVQQQGQGGKPAQNFTQGQTYTDAKGNKAKWDGQKFVPA